jgi:hypothetical protein
MIQELRGIF